MVIITPETRIRCLQCTVTCVYMRKTGCFKNQTIARILLLMSTHIIYGFYLHGVCYMYLFQNPMQTFQISAIVHMIWHKISKQLAIYLPITTRYIPAQKSIAGDSLDMYLLSMLAQSVVKTRLTNDFQ